jgi:hypothetical protein
MATPATAGYSGKPLWQKLGLAAGMRVHVASPPPQLDRLLAGAPKDLVRLPRLAECDFALAFVTKRRDVEGAFTRIAPKLAVGGMLWFAWPKRASGVATDVTEDALREIVLPRGFVDVKVCAIDATWSGLKFLRRKTTSG